MVTDWEKKYHELEQLIKRTRITGIVGGSLHESSGGTTIEFSQSSNFVLGRIVDYERLGEAFAWKYTIVPVKVNEFNDVEDAGDSSAYAYACNLIEINNPPEGKGVHGNGVDNSADDWPEEFYIMPCPIDTIVMLWPIGSITGIRYCFNYANGVDGTC